VTIGHRWSKARIPEVSLKRELMLFGRIVRKQSPCSDDFIQVTTVRQKQENLVSGRHFDMDWINNRR